MSTEKVPSKDGDDGMYVAGSSVQEVGSPHSVHNSSWLSRLDKKLQLDSATHGAAGNVWSNADLDPVEPSQRNSSSWSFAAYWLCDAVAPGNLRLGSSLVALGLSWRTSIGVIALGHFLASLAIAANGVIGARLHVPYTIQSRAAFGFFFSYFVVFVRMLVGFFWYGINTYNGALCIRAVLIAIWPSFATLPNTLPASANIITGTMIAYTIYFLIVLPFHYIHPRKPQWFFNVKVLLCIPAIIGMLIWACQSTGGGLHTTLVQSGGTAKGAAYSWVMIGNYGTMAVNINDFARYSRRERSVYVQIVIVPLSFAMMAFVGVIIAGAASDIYNVNVWDPLTILSYWTGSSGARAGAAFCGLSFVLAQLGANISANCISAANDLNAMAPRYINLRRGSYIIAFIGSWALIPWNILSSAEALVNFMGGYTIWLAPITGILLSDYYFVHSRRYAVGELYQPTGIYPYNKLGTNWRAVVAWCIGWVPLAPGFAQGINPSLSLPLGAVHSYYLSYLYGLFASAFVYTALSRLFPPGNALTHGDVAEAELEGHHSKTEGINIV